MEELSFSRKLHPVLINQIRIQPWTNNTTSMSNLGFDIPQDLNMSSSIRSNATVFVEMAKPKKDWIYEALKDHDQTRLVLRAFATKLPEDSRANMREDILAVTQEEPWRFASQLLPALLMHCTFRPQYLLQSYHQHGLAPRRTAKEISPELETVQWEQRLLQRQCLTRDRKVTGNSWQWWSLVVISGRATQCANSANGGSTYHSLLVR